MTAGASTPDWVVDEIETRLRAMARQDSGSTAVYGRLTRVGY